jgi:hypothetical protein
MRVSVNILQSNSLAKTLCGALAKGIKAAGDTPVMRTERDHTDMEDFDAAVFYGFVVECQDVMNACKRVHIPWVFCDLGYWQRDTHYKVCVNDRHPEAYMMKRAMPADRLKSFGVSIQPWRKGGQNVLVAGMSGKAAWSWGMPAESFERDIIVRLRRIATKRPIIYKAKPSFAAAKKIEGAQFNHKTPINDLLKDAHCVVTYHSNVGVDALVAGVPVFADRGAASKLALPTALLDTRLELPWFPEGREQWAANLAYCQWSVQEMADGSCWKHMRSVMEYA